MGQLFSKKNKEVFSTPLGLNNPVTVQVLGICSALAVTAKLEPAIVMGNPAPNCFFDFERSTRIWHAAPTNKTRPRTAIPARPARKLSLIHIYRAPGGPQFPGSAECRGRHPAHLA